MKTNTLRTAIAAISLFSIMAVSANAQSPKVDTKNIGTKKAITTVKSSSRKTEAAVGKDARKAGKYISNNAKSAGKTISKDSRKLEKATGKMLGIKK